MVGTLEEGLIMEKDTLLALASRCEAASGPDRELRELDAAIWDACGLVDEGHCKSWCSMNGRTDLTRAMYILAWAPRYCWSLDAALSLVPEGCDEAGVSWYPASKAIAELSTRQGVYSGEAAAPALAL
jgi:hypothetical protein